MQTMPTKSETWNCIKYGMQVTEEVFTTKLPGESQEAFCARHEEAVEYFQSTCPPI